MTSWERHEGSPPAFAAAGKIEVDDGPESLEVDAPRRRAYGNTWHDHTVAIDLESRAIVARWPNGCKGAPGLALDTARGVAFVGCTEGKATALDLEHGGKLLGSAETSKCV